MHRWGGQEPVAVSSVGRCLTSAPRILLEHCREGTRGRTCHVPHLRKTGNGGCADAHLVRRRVRILLGSTNGTRLLGLRTDYRRREKDPGCTACAGPGRRRQGGGPRHRSPPVCFLTSVPLDCFHGNDQACSVKHEWAGPRASALRVGHSGDLGTGAEHKVGRDSPFAGMTTTRRPLGLQEWVLHAAHRLRDRRTGRGQARLWGLVMSDSTLRRVPADQRKRRHGAITGRVRPPSPARCHAPAPLATRGRCRRHGVSVHGPQEPGRPGRGPAAARALRREGRRPAAPLPPRSPGPWVSRPSILRRGPPAPPSSRPRPSPPPRPLPPPLRPGERSPVGGLHTELGEHVPTTFRVPVDAGSESTCAHACRGPAGSGSSARGPRPL